MADNANQFVGGPRPLGGYQQEAPTQTLSINKIAINSEPHNLSGRQIVAKTLIGLIIGGAIAALLFVILSFIGSMFSQAISSGTTATAKPNPLLPLLLLFIGFISTFIGNMIVAGLYNLFYSKKYYDSSKMFGLLLLTNGILFLIFAPIYLVFNSQVETLFLVLGFHILFSVFVSSNQIEFFTNPNYSGSALMGNVLGFAMSILVYSLIYTKLNFGSPQEKVNLLMIWPSVLGYTLTPFFLGLWEKVYYKFYQMGNNSLYIPSLSEVIDNTETSSSDSQSETINVEQ